MLKIDPSKVFSLVIPFILILYGKEGSIQSQKVTLESLVNGKIKFCAMKFHFIAQNR